MAMATFNPKREASVASILVSCFFPSVFILILRIWQTAMKWKTSSGSLRLQREHFAVSSVIHGFLLRLSVSILTLTIVLIMCRLVIIDVGEFLLSKFSITYYTQFCSGVMRAVVRVRVTVTGRRRFPCLRTLLLLIPLFFLCLQLHVSSLSSARDSLSQLEAGNDSALILSMVPQVLHKFLTAKPRNSSGPFNGSLGNDSWEGRGLGNEEMLRNIRRYNNYQTIINEDIFGPVQNDTLIIVVQVHTRIVYLRHLIVSLAQAQGIETTLIVFSHDFYDQEANELVQSVDFARVMQIFYPFSIQTHPDTFPGQSKDDCPRDINFQQAQILRCTNADHPDLYGHYREAKFTQTKHHWWWKANRVFNQLEVTRNHSGLVLFLEEDHYVAEDFIHVLRQMQLACATSCPQCNILSLGTYLKTYNYYGDTKKKEALRAIRRHQTLSGAGIPPSWGFHILPSLYQHYHKAEVTPWISSKHNMGMAFNRSVWSQLHRCAQHFCSYDDYNWDWSLQQVSQQCLRSKLMALVMRGPRVFHIGECGVHHKKANCESTAVISKVQKVLANAKSHLYPKHLTLTFTTITKKSKLRKGNGGWGDIRDHQLCMNISLPVRALLSSAVHLAALGCDVVAGTHWEDRIVYCTLGYPTNQQLR